MATGILAGVEISVVFRLFLLTAFVSLVCVVYIQSLPVCSTHLGKSWVIPTHGEKFKVYPDAQAEMQEMSGYELQSEKNLKQFVLLEHMVGLMLCAGTSRLLQKH